MANSAAIRINARGVRFIPMSHMIHIAHQGEIHATSTRELIFQDAQQVGKASDQNGLWWEGDAAAAAADNPISLEERHMLALATSAHRCFANPCKCELCVQNVIWLLAK